jgi:photosystem II stability/assembly factor-like uncharacterized protein
VHLPSQLGLVAYSRMTFVDASHGWVLLASQPGTAQELWVLLRTTDGGRTWSLSARTGSGAFLGLAYDGIAMTFRSPAQGWIAALDPWSGGLLSVDVFRTDDGGARWQLAVVPLPPSDATQVESIEAPVFASAEDGSITVKLRSGPLEYRTTDGGVVWTPPPSAPGDCFGSDLSVHGGRQGENTFAFGQVLFTNVGRVPCFLAAIPTSIQLVRSDGSVLGTQMRPTSAEVTPVLLEPGAPDAATMDVYWGNWCGAAPGPLQIRVTFPGDLG